MKVWRALFSLLLALGSLCLSMGAQARYDEVEFFHIIARDDVGSVRKVLAEGEYTANTFNYEGFSALYLALREPSPKVADVLIEDPRTKLNLENAWGENALMMAAMRGLLPQTIRMMELGAQVNKKGWAPLHYAASAGQLEVMKLLLANYAYIDAQAPTGETPLMMAAARGTPAAVELLLEAEADPKLKNAKRQTAVDMALARGNTQNAALIRAWIARGGKPSPSPSKAPVLAPVPRAATGEGGALPMGSGSVSQNNYGANQAEAAVASPAPAPLSTPLPTPTANAELVVTPSPSPEAAAVQVQAVPEPGSEAMPESVPEVVPEAVPEAVPEPEAADEVLTDEAVLQLQAPSQQASSQQAAQLTEPSLSEPKSEPPPGPAAADELREVNEAEADIGTGEENVVNIIAAPLSRAMQQILAPPAKPHTRSVR